MNPILISKAQCDSPVKCPVRLFLITAGVSVALMAFGSISCATTAGFGRDVQKVGDKIEDSTRR